VGLERRRFDPERTDAGIPAREEAVEVVDACDLEPDEVRRVVCDPLRVGLREPDLHLGGEMEFHYFVETIGPSVTQWSFM
jgi:hypothetical protein